ncbi:glutathione hydrolase 1 isoform X1 [Cryptomeria japonica]|uniref:glutathione hydrolase 1 isoform X1 n=1 Tax=Cryptomeria japonica TaxID=3369 RepID=UPI0027DA2691|nr:glutathione hydrolase 1 isoform X1 [Cryptomeria japonica]
MQKALTNLLLTYPELLESFTYIAILSVVLWGLEPCQASVNVYNHISSGRREVVEAHKGAVAADDGRCSRIGRDVLKEDGHALDAAVATALCLGVVSPASSGIGGGAFMLVRLASGEAEAYDSRETAPASASENMYVNNPLSKSSGARAVAVPGELVGLYQAWQKYGRIPWKRLVLPAAHLAESFIVSPYLAFQMNDSKAAIFADKGLRNVFTSNGKLLQAGDKCHNFMLAKTLKAIAEYGPKVFYNGTVGVNLVKDVRKAGGILTFKDLQNYKIRVQKPLSADIMGYKILGMPPPSSGGAGMILVLNILASYGVPSASYGVLGLHRMIEAFKHMFAVRMNLGDPDFVNVTNVLADMLSPKFAAELKKTIYDNMTFGPSHYGGKWNEIDDHGTSHFSIVDVDRNAVSITSTVNAYFGAKLLSQKTGIVLNNEMDDFSIESNSSGSSLPPAPPNFIRPFKRPLSSMTPTILLQDGQLRAVLGASGGIKIIAATTQLFLNYFIKKMEPLASIMEPRVYHQLIPNFVDYEKWTTVLGDHIELSEKIVTGLEKRGHKLRGVIGGSICQMIVHDLHSHTRVQNLPKNVVHGKLIAVSDPRKGGFPAGF